jgi:hypothetical protein
MASIVVDPPQPHKAYGEALEWARSADRLRFCMAPPQLFAQGREAAEAAIGSGTIFNCEQIGDLPSW